MKLMLCLFALSSGMAAIIYPMLGRRRETLIATVIAGIAYTLLNVALALSWDDQKPVLLLIIPSLWMAGTAGWTLYRTRVQPPQTQE